MRDKRFELLNTGSLRLVKIADKYFSKLNITAALPICLISHMEDEGIAPTRDLSLQFYALSEN